MAEPKRVVMVDRAVFTSDRPDAEPQKSYVQCELGEENGVGQVYIYPPGQMQPQWVWKQFVKGL